MKLLLDTNAYAALFRRRCFEYVSINGKNASNGFG